MTAEPHKSSFICPECGGTERGDEIFVSTVPDPMVPASAVLHWIICKGCDSEIPAHLAERWDDLSITEAQEAWRETYKTRKRRRTFKQ